MEFRARTGIVLLLERYAQGGDVLILGCGAASVVGAMRSDSYSSILGLDISAEAIHRARAHASPRVQFELADMETFECPKKYHALLFSESLYYISAFKRKALLQRLAGCLAESGVIIVTIAQPQRFSALLEMIRANFHSVEDRTFRNSERHLLVFRSPPAEGKHK